MKQSKCTLIRTALRRSAALCLALAMLLGQTGFSQAAYASEGSGPAVVEQPPDHQDGGQIDSGPLPDGPVNDPSSGGAAEQAPGEPAGPAGCDCTVPCAADAVNDACPVCKEGFEKCALAPAVPPALSNLLERIKNLAGWYDALVAEDPARVNENGVLLDEAQRDQFLTEYDAVMDAADALATVHDSGPDIYGMLTGDADFVRLTTLYRAMLGYLPAVPDLENCICAEPCAEDKVNMECPVCAEDYMRCAQGIAASDNSVAAVPGVLVEDGATLTSASYGVTLGPGTYYVKSNITISNASAGSSGITIANNSDVKIVIEKDCTLTVRGGNGSGRTGGGAGIYLPASSTLSLWGEGTVKATGGAAGNGNSGSPAGSASRSGNDRGNYDGVTFYTGSGGAGGPGGGGAGAGIGGPGGTGGTGGTGGARVSTEFMHSTNGGKWNVAGNYGSTGSSGAGGISMGTLYVLDTVKVTAASGAAGSAGSGGATGTTKAWWHGSWSTWNAYAAGGGGGGGGAGLAAPYGIGGGGAGGGGGGGGGSGAASCTDYKVISRILSINGGGGGGGGGKGGSGGGSITQATSIPYEGTATTTWGTASKQWLGYPGNSSLGSPGGAGGSSTNSNGGGKGGSAGSSGGNGTLYVVPTAHVEGGPAPSSTQLYRLGVTVVGNVTVAVSSSSAGSFNTDSGTGYYKPATTVTLTAKVPEGVTFLGWSGDGITAPNTNQTITVTMPYQDLSLTCSARATVNASVKLQKDGAAWTGQAVTLKQDADQSGAPLEAVWNEADNTYGFNVAADGEYSVCLNGKDTMENITVTNGASSPLIMEFYTVTYDGNGGTGDVPADAVYKRGTVVDVAFSPTPVKEGSVFMGWAETPDADAALYTRDGKNQIGTADQLQLGDLFPGIKEKKTLYAVYAVEAGIGVLTDYPVGNKSILTVQVTLGEDVNPGSEYGVVVNGEKYPATGKIQGGKYIVQLYDTKEQSTQDSTYVGKLDAGKEYTIQYYINGGAAQEAGALTYTTKEGAKQTSLTYEYGRSPRRDGTFTYNGLKSSDQMVYRTAISSGLITSVGARNQMLDVFGAERTVTSGGGWFGKPTTKTERPQTSFQGAGWMVVNHGYGTDQSKVQTWVVPTIITGASGNQYVVMTYCFRNNTDSKISNYKIGSHSDIMIGDNDYAPIYREPYGFRMAEDDDSQALQFAVITNKEAMGGGGIASIVNTCNTLWYGNYKSRLDNVFAMKTPNALTGTDSGAAFSWLIPELAPGEVGKRSVVIGIADKAALDKDVVEPPKGGFEDLGNLQPEPVTPDPDSARGKMIGGEITGRNASVTLRVEVTGKTFTEADSYAVKIGDQTYPATAEGLHTETTEAGNTIYYYVVEVDGLAPKTSYTATPVIGGTAYEEYDFGFTVPLPEHPGKEETPNASYDAEKDRLEDVRVGDMVSVDGGDTWFEVTEEIFTSNESDDGKGWIDLSGKGVNENDHIQVKTPGMPEVTEDSDVQTVQVGKRPTPTEKTDDKPDGEFSVTQPTAQDSTGSIKLEQGGSGDYVYQIEGETEWKPWPGDGTLGELPQGAVVHIKRPAKGSELESEELVVTINKFFGGLVTVSDYDSVYDGQAHGISIRLSGDAANATVTYYTDNTYTEITTEPKITHVKDGPKMVYYTVAKSGYGTLKGSAQIRIRKAPLTAAYKGETFVYNGIINPPRPSYAVEVTGFANGETADGSNKAEGYTAPTVSGGSVSAAGAYFLSPTGGAADDYEFVYVGGYLTITPKVIPTFIFDNTVVYDGQEHTISVNTPPPVGGVEVKYGIAENDYNLTYPPKYKDVGSYPVYYQITGPNIQTLTGSAVITITQRPLVVERATATGSRVFDGTLNADSTDFDIKLILRAPEANNGLVSGENVTVKGTAYFTSPNVEDKKQLNVTDLRLEGPHIGNYFLVTKTLSFQPVEAKITAKEVSLDWSNTDAKTYDGQPADVRATIKAGGLIQGPGINYLCQVNVTGGNEVNAGSHRATAVLSNGNYKIKDGEGTQWYTIKKATLTAAYEGAALIFKDTVPDSAKHVTVTGFVNGETADTAAGYTAPRVTLPGNDQLTVGDHKLIPSGGDATNYDFDYVEGTLTVKSRKFNAVVVRDYIGDYDGQPHSPFVENTDPAANSATIRYYETQAAADADTTNISGDTTVPAITYVSESPKTVYYKVSAPDYDTQSGTATITIKPRKVSPTLSAGDNPTRPYNGTDNASGQVKLGLTGVLDADKNAVTVAAASTVFADKNAGANKSVTASGLSLSGDKSVNYALTDASVSAGGASLGAGITAKEVTLTWNGADGLVYTGTPQNVTATANGLENGDSCGVIVTGGGETNVKLDADGNVASYTATASLTNGNYRLPAEERTKDYIIAKATLNAAYIGEAIDYGQPPKLEIAVAGFQNSETALRAAGYEAPAISGDIPTAVGGHKLTPAGGKADNYVFSYDEGTLTITAASLNGLVNAKDYAGFYDGQPHGITVSAPAGAKVCYYESQSAADADADGKGSTDPIKITHAASKSVWYKVFLQNHHPFAGSETIITIKPKPLTAAVKPDSVGSKVYDATTAVTGGQLVLEGVVGSDQVTASGSFAFTDAKAGKNKKVAVTGITLLGGNGNYELTKTDLADVATSAEIKPRTVALTWNGAENLVYTGRPQAVTATAGGIVGGDACRVIVDGGAETNVKLDADGNVLAYTARASGLSNPNYKLPSYGTAKTYVIAKAPLRAVYKGEEITYGTDPALAIEVTGFVPGESAANAEGYEAPTLPTPIPTNTGSHQLKPQGGKANNYSFLYAAGTLKITNGSMNVTAESYAGVYDGKPHGITVTVQEPGSTVKYYGDARHTQELTGGAEKITNAADSPKTIYYVVTNPNYNTEEGSATITIEPKEATLVWSGHQNLVYDGTEKTVTAAVGNLVEGDACQVVVSGGANTVPGSYTAKAERLSNPNYKLPTQATQAYTIAKGTITGVTADPYEGVFDGQKHDGVTVAGTRPSDKIWYSTDGGHTWSETVPQVGAKGDTPIKVKVAREHCDDHVTTVTASVKSSPEIVIHKPVFDPDDVKKVTVGGMITEGDYPVLSQIFEIRRTGTDDWTPLNAGTASGNTILYEQTLTKLEPGTEYELRLTATDTQGNKGSGTLKFMTQPEKPPVGEIEGSLDGDADGAVTVTIEMGNTVMGTIQGLDPADPRKNTFKFTGLPDGEYNLVATDTTTGHKVTVMVTVKGSMTTPDPLVVHMVGKKQSTVKVKGEAPPVAAGGLNDLFETPTFDTDAQAAVTEGGTVEIRLTAAEAKKQSEVSDIRAEAGAQKVGVLVDLQVDMLITPKGGLTTVKNLPEVESLLTVAIPLPDEAVGQTGYRAYRHHGGVEELRLLGSGETPAEKTFRIDGRYAYVYSQKFSTYAITYSQRNSGGSGSGNSHSDYCIITPTAGAGGKIRPALPVQVRSGDSAGFTITPDDGYEIADVQVDGKSVGPVEEYLFTRVRYDHAIAASFRRIEEAPSKRPDPGAGGANETGAGNPGGGPGSSSGADGAPEQSPDGAFQKQKDKLKEELLKEHDRAVESLPDTLTAEQRAQAVEELDRIYNEAVQKIDEAMSAAEASAAFNQALRDFEDVLAHGGRLAEAVGAPNGAKPPFILLSALMALLAVAAAVLAWRRGKKGEGTEAAGAEANNRERRHSTAIAAAAALLAVFVFLLTTGWNGILLANGWTVIVALLAAVSIWAACRRRNRHEKTSNETSER